MTADGTAVPASSPTVRTNPRALQRSLEALYARVPLGMRLGLEAMRAACMHAENPERTFTIAHIAGTNGKGSTSAMVESMGRAAGKKTGLYTSPHLCRFAERIRIDGEPISDATLADVLERALTLGPDLSFFETATLAAFLAFRDHGVDIAVIEVGIGGRLDATNVVAAPRVCAITRVAFDHMDRLGNTLEEIAREKAGIAKRGVPIVLGPMTPEVRAAALEVALDAGALPIVMGDDPDAVTRDSIALGVRGAYQIDNARIASRVARELGIPEAARREGLEKTRWPGRYEPLVVTVEQGGAALAGSWILDGAHNPDGARALVHALAEEGVVPGAIVFGALADKAWREMVDILAELPCPRVYASPQGRAATTPADLAERAPGDVAGSLEEALVLARRHADKAALPVVVCGSLYLVGEARGLLLNLPSDPPSRSDPRRASSRSDLSSFFVVLRGDWPARSEDDAPSQSRAVEARLTPSLGLVSRAHDGVARQRHAADAAQHSSTEEKL